MKKQEKVKVSICGRTFYLTSGDDPEYIENIAKKIDKEVSTLMRGNVGITFEQASILIALKYCDDYEKKSDKQKKKSDEEENLGKRLVEYSKELTRATAKIKSLEKELAKMKKKHGEESEPI